MGVVMKEATSKHIDGITDLIVVAPIKDGFINAFESITFATRLKLVSEALNRVRVSAREHERIVPFSDVTERILSLFDFRVGILDKDMFGLVPGAKEAGKTSKGHLETRRYLYLTATFEGGWEPYMRQIWKPLGAFLDLLFCNCEGYVTATEHSFAEYSQWVRDNQVDSAIFYNTTGLTVRDQKYLAQLERAQRESKVDDAALAALTMAYPEEEAAATRLKDENQSKAVELALEALTVLYKLADYYPPEWMTGTLAGKKLDYDGHRLVRAAHEILHGWDGMMAAMQALADSNPADPDVLNKARRYRQMFRIYAEPINWYRTGLKELARRDAEIAAKQPADPDFDKTEVQAGILKAHGSKEHPVRHGALLMFTVRKAKESRAFIKLLLDEGRISFEGDKETKPDATLFTNIAFTPQGLLQLNMYRDILDRFPKEFREGLAPRSGIVGDMRENHPRNWILPDRNGPEFTGDVPAGTRLPPVNLDEVDFVIQLRSTGADRAEIEAEVRALATAAKEGATLEAIDWLMIQTDRETGMFRDHFGYLDGISQPRPRMPGEDPQGLPRDAVALGEVLTGYGNDQGDAAPRTFATLDADKPDEEADTNWRRSWHGSALNFQQNGSFLVLRKIGEEVGAFAAWLDENKSEIADHLGCSAAEARALLKAAIMGRDEKGCPLAAPAAADLNDFDYGTDKTGLACPYAAHIRKANPRKIEFDRPTPRLVRRGMLFGEEGSASRGLMFMSYSASISEQYEVIQRWLNGGNSTDVSSANIDPLTGVQPKGDPHVFRFLAKGKGGDTIVIRVPLPAFKQIKDHPAEPGRHPFTPLYWGLYLFAPSRSALTSITGWQGGFRHLVEMKEKAIGQAWLDRMKALSIPEAAKEWKQVLEDFGTKDPTEKDISPHLWAAIRYYHGGAFNLRRPDENLSLEEVRHRDVANRMVGSGILKGNSNENMSIGSDEGSATTHQNFKSEVPDYDWADPNKDSQNAILCAGETQVLQILSEWENFSSEEQLRRIMPGAGPIYVTQQPDDAYKALDPTYKGKPLNYHEESFATNKALFDYGEEQAFAAGYRAGTLVLNEAKRAVESINALGGPQRHYFKMELKRQFIQPAIAEVWKLWYGLPDDKALFKGGWSWKRIVSTLSEADPDDVARTQALCPGDFMAPSRGSVFPRPGPATQAFAEKHGTAILQAGRDFVARHRADTKLPKPPLLQKLLQETSDDEVLARNIIGTMIGAIPPMDANLRNIILDWLLEKRLWRHQAALKRVLAGADVMEKPEAVRAALRGPISQAMCKRPAPDLLFRTAKGAAEIKVHSDKADVTTQEGDLVVVSLASASQWSLYDDPKGEGDVSIIFGGKRSSAYQGYIHDADGKVVPDPHRKPDEPVHACPATKMAMGAMTGILAALLDAGTIQALPASLIIKISDWPEPTPAP